MIVAVTGHRPQKLGGFNIQPKLERFARVRLENILPGKVITGMALGWDQAIAKACIQLDIPFIAAVPFRGQDFLWPLSSSQIYEKLLSKAEKIIEVSPLPYTSRKMQLRNEWMCEHAGRLLALWDGSPGGTANCIAYARGRKLPIENVYEFWRKFQ